MKPFLYILILLLSFFYSCKDKGFGDFGGENTFIRFYGTENTDIIHEVLELKDNSGYAFIGITNAKILENNRDLINGESKIFFNMTDRFGSTINSYIYGFNDFDLDSGDFEAYSMKQTFDGEFIVGGTFVNTSKDTSKMFLLALNSIGQNPLLKIYDKPINANTNGREVTLIADGGYALIGSILENDEINGSQARLYDFFTVRATSNLDNVWSHTYGSDNRKNDLGVAIVQTDDGGFVWLGTAQNEQNNLNTQIRVASFSSLGHPIWDFLYGGDGIDAAWSIFKISEGYIIAGTTSNGSKGGSDIYLIKINKSGALLSENFIGTPNDDTGLSIKPTSDNGFIITGSSIDKDNGKSDIYLAKVDFLLNLEWDNTFGGDGVDVGFSVIQSSDGGYLIGGMTQLETITMMSLIKTDSKGRVAE